MKKREFLKISVAGASALLLNPSDLLAKGKTNIGLQLYTVRDLMAKDARGTLEQIAKLGYKELETAGYNKGQLYGMKPVEFNQIVQDLGMKIVSGHLPWDQFESEWPNILQMCNDIDQKYAVFPWLPPEKRNSIDLYKQIAEMLNKCGEEANQSEKVVGYHNHDFEYFDVEGQVPMDVLLAETDADKVQFELDLFWVSKAGKSHLDIFKRDAGRYSLWHVKDKDADGNFAEVGNGDIDFATIFENKKTSGMKHFFVEQDRSDDPMKSIGISVKNVKKLI